jgi:hypothetical protein
MRTSPPPRLHPPPSPPPPPPFLTLGYEVAVNLVVAELFFAIVFGSGGAAAAAMSSLSSSLSSLLSSSTQICYAFAPALLEVLSPAWSGLQCWYTRRPDYGQLCCRRRCRHRRRSSNMRCDCANIRSNAQVPLQSSVLISTSAWSSLLFCCCSRYRCSFLQTCDAETCVVISFRVWFLRARSRHKYRQRGFAPCGRTTERRRRSSLDDIEAADDASSDSDENEKGGRSRRSPR